MYHGMMDYYTGNYKASCLLEQVDGKLKSNVNKDSIFCEFTVSSTSKPGKKGYSRIVLFMIQRLFRNRMYFYP